MAIATIPELTLPADEVVHIWCVDLDAATSQERAMQSLSPEEQERAARFATEVLQRRYVLAHAALRHILSSYIYKCASELDIRLGEGGKPYLPEYQHQLSFNLSHSRRYALVAVTNGSQVGVDIEYVQRDVDQQALAQRFFSAAEARQLANSKDLLAFFRLWTRKEAFVKATGQGLRFPLDQFSVDCGLGEGNLLLDVASNLAKPDDWQLRNSEAPHNYVAAVAVAGGLQLIEHYSYEFH